MIASKFLHCCLRQRFVRNTSLIRCFSSQTAVDDGDSQKIRTVYIGGVTQKLKLVKYFSLGSSAIALLLQPFIFQQILLTQSLLLGSIVGSLGLGYIIGTPLALHYLTKRYVVKMTFCPETETFEAVVMTLLVRSRTITFKASDVEIPSVPGPFTSLLAKGYPLLINFNDFLDADVYEHLVGLDRGLEICIDGEKVKKRSDQP